MNSLGFSKLTRRNEKIEIDNGSFGATWQNLFKASRTSIRATLSQLQGPQAHPLEKQLGAQSIRQAFAP